MNLPKMILCDLDGTLLPETKVMTETTRNVMHEMADRGVRIGLATGKFYNLTEQYADLLGPETPVISLDGARNRFSSSESTSSGIPVEKALELAEIFRDYRMNLFADSGEDELLLRSPEPEIPEFIQHWSGRVRRFETPLPPIRNDSGLVSFYRSLDDFADGELNELEALARDCEKRFPEMRATTHRSDISHHWRVMFQHREITKGSGLRELLAHFGVEPSECMVFGDWHNDIPLFQTGCVNVAMANAVPPVKELANHITEKDCDHDGVADFLKRAFLS